MMVADHGNSANRSEGQISPPGAAGGWGDPHFLLSLPPRRLPATFTPSIILIYNTCSNVQWQLPEGYTVRQFRAPEVTQIVLELSHSPRDEEGRR